MSERQRHGFDFEENIKKLMGKNIKMNKNYTGKHDAYYIDGNPINIKTAKINKSGNFKIDMGSPKNLSTLSKPYIYIILGIYYNQKDILLTSKEKNYNLQNIERIKKELIKNGFEDVWFFKIPRENFLELLSLEVIKTNIAKNEFLKYRVSSKEEQKRTNNEWKKYRKKTKKNWNTPKRKAIQPYFKRDSKGQCRIQCGITKNNVIKYLKKYMLN